ncbi:hypothetical protein BDA96_05G204200 [Sorghum bicolor]|uniref:Uncharacterized protein n=2 Tax=Sorghum bicolor TaxID=4558 RepID=A0A921R1P1_SORBI|nr:hypothetical protein BDA96_05G204200 [Sorghum bicolor]KXG28941.1 hypothetical protein SORBI_3005G187600 [Sorghum bicolor]
MTQNRLTTRQGQKGARVRDSAPPPPLLLSSSSLVPPLSSIEDGGNNYGIGILTDLMT